MADDRIGGIFHPGVVPVSLIRSWFYQQANLPVRGDLIEYLKTLVSPDLKVLCGLEYWDLELSARLKILLVEFGWRLP